jgi:hypothetical protein
MDITWLKDTGAAFAAVTGDVRLEDLLAACGRLPALMDALFAAPLASMVKSDLEGNISALRTHQKAAADAEATGLSLARALMSGITLPAEQQSTVPSRVAALWLYRASLFMVRVCLPLRDDPVSEPATTAAAAYSSTLEPFHSWPVAIFFRGRYE